LSHRPEFQPNARLLRPTIYLCASRSAPTVFYSFCKNLAAPIFIKKGQFFGHSSPLFSSDVPHRTQKDGSTDQKLSAFLIENRWLSSYLVFFMQKLIVRLAALPLLALLLTQSAWAQDKHFTQFYAAPLALNPALTGAFEGRYRVNTIYRDQWRNVLDEPIQTFGVAGDFRFAPRRATVQQDAWGVGLQFLNDRVSVVDFNTTQIGVSLAYHKSLGVSNRQFLSVGLQGAMVQRNVNYAALNFQDEFDGLTGYTLGTGEELPGNNFSFGDLGVGLNYTAKIGDRSSVFAGVAMHHILEPSISFYDSTATGDRLFRKYSAQLMANLPIGGRQSRVSWQPRLLVAAQGPHLEVNVGTNFRTALGEYGTTAMHLGGWVRPVRSTDAMNLDAAVVLLGFEINNVLLGLSYDLNLRALQAGQRQGAFEISIGYLGNFEGEGIQCPKF
jgi:type IX secretion system PorP/SprF family membrane protein